MDEQFLTQEKALLVRKRKQNQLISLLEVLKTEGFDKEDMSIVETHLDTLTLELQQKTAQLEATKKLYNTQVKGVKEQISKRQVILEKQMKTLESFPQIMTYFAQKQASLQDGMDGICEQLRNGKT